MKKTIVILIGTKAQFIKMAPVCILMDRQGIDYQIVDLCQHGSMTAQILADFNIQGPVTTLLEGNRSTKNYKEVGKWFLRCLAAIVAGRKLTALRTCPKNGVALVHGDTLSTLVGYYLAKRLGWEVGLVEAGLTSKSFFEPFPEEAIRRHVESRANFLFATERDYEQRLRMRKKKSAQIFNIKYNTGKDALLYMVTNSPYLVGSNYSVFTLHRAETLASKQRMVKALSYIIEISKLIGNVKFFIHEPTAAAISKFNLGYLINGQDRIQTTPLESYRKFSLELARASYVLTDGGSVQEEASYLAKPCLIFRNRTERNDGLGVNAKICSYDVEQDTGFLLAFEGGTNLQRPSYVSSKLILQALGVYSGESNV